MSSRNSKRKTTLCILDCKLAQLWRVAWLRLLHFLQQLHSQFVASLKVKQSRHRHDVSAEEKTTARNTRFSCTLTWLRVFSPNDKPWIRNETANRKFHGELFCCQLDGQSEWMEMVYNRNIKFFIYSSARKSSCSLPSISSKELNCEWKRRTYARI